MADITKCKGVGCDKSTSCYRFVARAGMMQSYFTESPMESDGTCEYYWKLSRVTESDRRDEREDAV